MPGAEGVFQAYLDLHGLMSDEVISPVWTQDGAAIWFLSGVAGNRIAKHVDLGTGQVSQLLDPLHLRAALALATGTEVSGQSLPFDSILEGTSGRLEFDYGGRRWSWDIRTSYLAPVDNGADVNRHWRRVDYLSFTTDVTEQISPDGTFSVSIRDHNIVLRTRANGIDRLLTSDGTSEVSWDVEADRVALTKGLAMTRHSVSPWAPDGMVLAAYRRDVRDVPRRPRVRWTGPDEGVDFLPYEIPGAPLTSVEPVFVTVRTGGTTAVRLDVNDSYIQLLGWHPEGSDALIVRYARNFRSVEIFRADRETGETRLVLREEGSSFVRIQHAAIYFGEHGFWILPSGSGFIWLSNRDGWDHLYLYDWNGQLVRQLTAGAWPVHDVAKIGGDGFVYFTSSIDTTRPYDVHVCRVPLVGGDIEQLTNAEGIHQPHFGPNAAVFLDTHSKVDRPARADLRETNGAWITTISTVDISNLEKTGYTAAEEFTVKASDGETDLWGVLYKPFNFDARIKYPVIESIYGGPQCMWAPRTFAAVSKFWDLPRALAQLGYIVVCLDARGTPGRSRAFHEVACGDWGAAVADHALAIRQLCARNPWMDDSRVGIYGGSWGGYFATRALMYQPQVYRAAVAFSPGYDLRGSILVEPYLGVGEQNSTAHERADIVAQAGALKGRLMILVGTADFGCLPSALEMTHALINAGIDHEVVVIPEAAHGFVRPNDRNYFLSKLTGWFDKHVKRRASNGRGDGGFVSQDEA